MSTSPPEPRAVCLGESMIVLVPDEAGPLEHSRVFHRSAGGAESNVAGTLAGLGVTTSWVSRLGADGFGRYVLTDIAARGVDVSGVELDPLRPTGLYVKERDTSTGRTGPGSVAVGVEHGGGQADRPGDGSVVEGHGAAGIGAGIGAAAGAGAEVGDVVGSPRRGTDTATTGRATVDPADGVLGEDTPRPATEDAGEGRRERGCPGAAGPGDVSRRRMHYYRTGSAASAMAPELLDGDRRHALFAAADLVHVTGITAGISDSAAELLFTLLRRPRAGTLISFDLNWRPILWHDRDPSTLARLCALADIVLLGADEAEAVFGTADPERLRDLLPEPRTVLVKDDAHEAVALDRDGTRTTVAALRVDVVDPVGAGDGFAAGYLAATLRGMTPQRCLRLGHLCAALALTVQDDHAPPPDPATVETLLTCTDQEWLRVRVGADGIRTPS
ncbi:2-dehydro-3-deoxygluconokinase [Actinoalloteichus hoggarensis]|uniref:2-dehydro-3-deoxygluconokinase n=1 Tax=Actinoalloteichus hoggarensis TaxID=1470176 RepID=A0A221W7X8_9PSEU|nr:sugar kinase [Actinoalloteichus hoggarensis]ASO21746.1 2-dehydro-3-deoxygluconokinase [Actinoalloteichus hoggarensis]MBB5922343.1 2-dehydro-3-deoxygluconokinase [Actinoalloteichus hoggarensis]